MGAGITSAVTQDANNPAAVALRGLGEIFKNSSDALMPELAAQSQYWQNEIHKAAGWNKMVEVGKWVINSPLSLTWEMSKEVTEDVAMGGLVMK